VQAVAECSATESASQAARRAPAPAVAPAAVTQVEYLAASAYRISCVSNLNAGSTGSGSVKRSNGHANLTPAGSVRALERHGPAVMKDNADDH
jgi:hypothetical protein